MIGARRHRAAQRLPGIAAVLLLLALGLALGLPRHRAGIDLSDEGLLVHGAERVLRGELPNRDFVSLQPPLSFYSTALAFRLLGVSLGSERLFGLLLYLLIPLGVYAVSRQVAGRVPSLAAALPAPFLGMTIWVYAPYPTAQGLVLSLAAAWLLLRAAGDDVSRGTGGEVPANGAAPARDRSGVMGAGRVGAAIGCGVATALVGLTRHDQGFYVVAATALFLIALPFLEAGSPGAGRRSRRLAACWLGGAAGVTLPLLLAWGVAGALPAMYRDLVRFPLTRYADTSALPMPRLLSGSTASEQALIALFYLAPVVCGGALLRLALRRARGPLQPHEVRGIFLVLLCLGFHHQVWTRSDVYHLVDTLPPLFAVGAFWMETLRRTLCSRWAGRADRPAWLPAAAAAAAGVLFWGGVVGLTHRTFILPRLDDGTALGGPRGGVVLPASEAWVGPTRDLLRREVPPGRSLLVLPYQPMLYFLAERRNPTAWNYFWPGDQTDEDFRLFLRQADDDPPAAVLLFGREEMQGHAAPVLEWVDRNYGEAGRGAGGAMRLYLPASRGEPPATRR